MGQRKQRNPSVEVFRCFLMFLIVLGHAQSFWCLGRGLSFNEFPYWIFVLVGLVVWHVDGFIGISGWYGIRFSVKKFIYLFSTIAFYGAFSAVCRWFFGSEPLSFSWLWGRGGWFGASYLVLMLCSPLLNAAVDSLAEKSKKALLLAWSMMAVAFALSWMPKHLFTGIHVLGLGHQTFLMMAFVYLTARTARKIFEGRVVPLHRLLSVVMVYIAFVFAYSIVVTKVPFGPRMMGLLTVNHAPHVYLVAMALLMIFVWHVRVPERMGRLFVRLAPSMFGVYLFHSTLIRWNGTSGVLSQEAISKLVGGDFGMVSILGITLFAFLASVLVDMGRRACVALIRPYFDPWLDRLDARLVALTGGGK